MGSGVMDRKVMVCSKYCSNYLLYQLNDGSCRRLLDDSYPEPDCNLDVYSNVPCRWKENKIRIILTESKLERDVADVY